MRFQRYFTAFHGAFQEEGRISKHSWLFKKAALGEARHVAIPMIVAAELWTGVEKNRKTHPQHVARLEAFLALFPIIDLTIADARCYAEIRATLEQKGQSIGPLDLFIAAQARRLNSILVTADVTEFNRVTGLKLLHWK